MSSHTKEKTYTTNDLSLYKEVPITRDKTKIPFFSGFVFFFFTISFLKIQLRTKYIESFRFEKISTGKNWIKCYKFCDLST